MAGSEHEELREQAALYVLGALAPQERMAFESHLTTCVECSAEVRSLAVVPALLAQTVPQVDPSRTLREQVLRSAGGGANVRLMPATPDHSNVSQTRDIPGTALGPWLAAAASLALTVGLGVYAMELRGRVGDLESRLRDALARADASERQIADTRRAATDAESRVALLAAPDLTRVDLAGQKMAPQASGRGYWSRSRGLMFTASNLPPLPAGRTYQFWVLTAQTPPISNGWLLMPDASGRVTAVFDTPVDLPKPAAMAVSIEPAGGVPAPTGDLYLVGRAGI
jgi:anti-sigma-K factor RskA